MMNHKIRIGTRKSPLALWQATRVAQLLQQKGYRTELVAVKSKGDLDLVTPLYEMDVKGIFTRHLDAAVISQEVDIAVHSMKDVPTVLAEGLSQAAVLKRGSFKDLLVLKESDHFLRNSTSSCTIATGSVRRRAQWLNRYPNSKVVGLRGNVNTRLRKLQENKWDGALFALAGLERINLKPEESVVLDWMLPAPAQGAIMIVCRTEDLSVKRVCSKINDETTAACVAIERAFLRALMGGCATPISALAQIEGTELVFEGNILTPDGKEKAVVRKHIPLSEISGLGERLGEEILKEGGREIVDKLNL